MPNLIKLLRQIQDKGISATGHFAKMKGANLHEEMLRIEMENAGSTEALLEQW